MFPKTVPAGKSLLAVVGPLPQYRKSVGDGAATPQFSGLLHLLSAPLPVHVSLPARAIWVEIRTADNMIHREGCFGVFIGESWGFRTQNCFRTRQGTGSGMDWVGNFSNRSHHET